MGSHLHDERAAAQGTPPDLHNFRTAETPD
jgi:hypothetical protein